MLTLLQFPTDWGIPNLSPFCMKIETYLRMSEIPFRIVWASSRGKPKRKLPVIDDDGTIVADSSLIIEYLKGRYGDKLDARLGPADRAVALAFRRLMEEHLYWCVLWYRWIDDAGWEKTRAAFFSGMPAFPRMFVPPIARRAMGAELDGQGVGRHAAQEIGELGKADLTALSTFLADKPFFLGDDPTSIDATAYAFLVNLLGVPVESPIKTHGVGLANLMAYCDRMKARFYPPDPARIG